jgi:superfamily II DNA or RNA helicase
MKSSRLARDVVRLTKINETFIKVSSEPSVVQELSEHLTFTVPGAKFMPQVRNKYWDGKIRLLNSMTGLTYTGLVKEIGEFCNSRNYDIELDPKLVYDKKFTEINEFVESLKLNPKYKCREYQIESLRLAVEDERHIFLSPTASGKSLSIYLITKYFNSRGHKTLVIVPTVSLVLQMKKDFEDYAGKGLDIHCITAGVDKESDSPIVISTWQSIYKMPKTWFAQFGTVVGDEVHLFKATSLKSIMEKLENTRYRFGFTGTLDGSLTNKITLEGLFGPVKQLTTTSELMEQNLVADLKIVGIILMYDSDSRKLTSKYTYQQEVDFLVRNEKRNKYIRNLAANVKGNTLILFQFVEKHGKVLYDMLSQMDTKRKVFFVHGGVEGEDREQIRAIVEQESDAIIVASYGTFSTGVNIRNLHNVILGSPSKSRVRVLQSIGRGLRLGEGKDQMTLYDIADDLKHRSRLNFTLEHFTERLNIYNSEQFTYKLVKVEL